MVQALGLAEAIEKLLGELLEQFAAAVPEVGEFPELAVSHPVIHRSHLNGCVSEFTLELSIRAMNARVSADFGRLRYLRVRVGRAGSGGGVSATLFHATAPELRKKIEALRRDPTELVESATALVEGLPVETDPDLWR